MSDSGSSATFKAINEEGIEVTCDILFTFDRMDTDKSYIVFTDNTVDDEGNVQVFASTYNPKALDGSHVPEAAELQLTPIETEEEWHAVETILNQLTEQIRG